MASDDDQRCRHIIDVLADAFADGMSEDPAAFRRKYRAMAKDPFAFYRGTACLFYADQVEREDRWADERTGRVWIQGDLHAGNFGTYMDGRGVLIFDVNDYDEAYLGHFTWDLQRMAASVAVMGWTKALPDDDITALITAYVRAYLDQVHRFVHDDRDHEWSLRLDTAAGAVRDALLEAQLSTRVAFLDRQTVVDDHVRRFRRTAKSADLGEEERAVVEEAYRAYLDTIPGSKRMGSLTYHLKDVVAATGHGVGSAAEPSYSLLVEGHTQALENDVVLTMKRARPAAASSIARDGQAASYFHHEGHRTAVSQRALQAHADPWLGWTQMRGGPYDGGGFVVRERSPYETGLNWSPLTDVAELAEALDQLGRATAKVHCVSDVDDESTPLVDFQTEEAIVEMVTGSEDELVADVVAFGLEYGARARADHALFVDAFRSGRIAQVDPSGERG